MKKMFFLLFSLTLFITFCSDEQNNGNNQPDNNSVINKDGYSVIDKNVSYNDLNSFEGKMVTFTGKISGKRFEHKLFYHSSHFMEMVHLDLNQYVEKMPYIVIYLNKNVDTPSFFKKYLNQKVVVHGKLGKVDGAFLNPEIDLLKQRKAHSEFYLDVLDIKISD